MLAFKKALENKTDTELLEILVGALVHDSDTLLAVISTGNPIEYTQMEWANAEMIESVCDIVKSRFIESGDIESED